jgi:hypothetical protein
LADEEVVRYIDLTNRGLVRPTSCCAQDESTGSLLASETFAQWRNVTILREPVRRRMRFQALGRVDNGIFIGRKGEGGEVCICKGSPI